MPTAALADRLGHPEYGDRRKTFPAARSIARPAATITAKAIGKHGARHQVVQQAAGICADDTGRAEQGGAPLHRPGPCG